MRNLSLVILILILIAVSGPCSSAQSNPRLQTFFEQNVGLTQDQIDDIRHGIPVVKILPVRASTEVFLFGAIYIHAAPESYPRLVLNLDNLRRLPNFLALRVFQQPPRLADLNGFSLDSDDLGDLRKPSCSPQGCR
ncbi:MAG: hypothetical protein WCF30_12570 [Terracidiphilus sp.]